MFLLSRYLEQSSEQSALVISAENAENYYQQNQKPNITSVVVIVTAARLAASWFTAIAEPSIVTHKKTSIAFLSYYAGLVFFVKLILCRQHVSEGNDVFIQLIIVALGKIILIFFSAQGFHTCAHQSIPEGHFLLTG